MSFDSIHDPAESMATRDEVDVFHAALMHHIKSTMGFKMTSLTLKEVVLPVVRINKNGRASIHPDEYVCAVQDR